MLFRSYDSPPTNVYKNVKDVLDKLNLEVDCAVVGTENDYNNKAAIILKYSKLLIPVTQFGEKEKENLLQKCSIKYAINPYLFDYELSTMPTTEDDTRIKANDMLVKESEMYSRYRVETKKVLNNMNSEIRKYLEQNGNQTEETFNTIPNKFLKARQSIVESVLSYENNEKNKNNEKNNYQVTYLKCRKEIQETLESIYNMYVTNKVSYGPEGPRVSDLKSSSFTLEDESSNDRKTSIGKEDRLHDNSAGEDESSKDTIEKEDHSLFGSDSNEDEEVKVGIYVSKYNLLNSNKSGILNINLYTQKLADEILRYNRIKNFILGPGSSIPHRIYEDSVGKSEALYSVSVSVEEGEKKKGEKKKKWEVDELKPCIHVKDKININTYF